MRNPRTRRDIPLFSIISPDLPPLDITRPIAAIDLKPGVEIEDAVLEKTELQNFQLPSPKLQGIRFLHVRASGSKFDNLKLLDALHDSCDWSNASWNHAHISRCAFVGCRMTGFNAADAKFENTRFTKCKLDLTVFNRTEFISCSFEDCVLHDSSFEEAILQDVIFKNCDLRNTRMVRARLAGVDLRGSIIQGFQAEPRDVRGLLIDPSQAIDLIHLLEVRVQKIDQAPPDTHDDNI